MINNTANIDISQMQDELTTLRSANNELQEKLLKTYEDNNQLIRDNNELKTKVIALQHLNDSEFSRANATHCQCCIFKIKIRNDNNQVDPDGDPTVSPGKFNVLLLVPIHRLIILQINKLKEEDWLAQPYKK